MKIRLCGLNEPEIIQQETKSSTRNIEKTFDYEEDIEELGKKLDKKNRENFSKEERDSLYITDADILEDINELRSGENRDFTCHIEKIKQEALKEEVLFSSENFDIFGGMTEDKTKINVLGNTKHREIKKSKFRILDINKETKNEQYIETLKNVMSYIESAVEKSEVDIKLNVFFASIGALNNQKYSILYINPKNALDTIKDQDKINLYNIKLTENTKAVALTNIIYYDNNNITLPLGMNVTDKVLVDMSKLKLEPKKQKLFRINQEVNDIEVKTKIICVYEYVAMEE